MAECLAAWAACTNNPVILTNNPCHPDEGQDPLTQRSHATATPRQWILKQVGACSLQARNRCSPAKAGVQFRRAASKRALPRVSFVLLDPGLRRGTHICSTGTYPKQVQHDGREIQPRRVLIQRMNIYQIGAAITAAIAWRARLRVGSTPKNSTSITILIAKKAIAKVIVAWIRLIREKGPRAAIIGGFQTRAT